MIFFLALLAALFAALIGQEFIPALPWLFQARVLLLPVVFFFAALALPYPLMLLLAFVAGFAWDALTVQAVGEYFELSLGWSIILYAALGSLVNGFRPLYRRGRWEIHCLLSGVCTSLIVLSEFLMITFRRGEFIFNSDVWWRIGGAGIVALIVAPFVYMGLSMVGYLTGHNARGGAVLEDATSNEN